MATKKPFIARHGINVGSTVVFGTNGKLHANNVITNGTITDAMLAGSTGSNLSKVQEVESNLLATNTAIRSLISSNDSDISNLQSSVSSNDTDISNLQSEDSALWTGLKSTNTAVRSYTDTAVANLVDSAPATLDTLNELAAALGDDANFATTVSTNLGQKLGGTASITLNGDVSGTGSFFANAVTITATVADDSHNHVLSNIDGITATTTELNYVDGVTSNIQTQLNGKQATLGTGSITATHLASNSVDSAELVNNSVDASHLNVSGNGTTAQFLRADGDGSFTWATPTDTDTVYTHPTSAGNKHIPSGGSAGQFLKYSASGTAVWASDNNTTYSVGDGGLTEKNFTTILKNKLDGIAEGATNVTNNNQLINGAGYITSYTNTTYSAGAGLDLTGTTFSVEPDLRGEVTQIGVDTNDYYLVDATTHKWYLDGVEDMRLTNNGQLDVEGSVVAHSSTVSDRNLKEDIQPIENALEKVNTLTGCTYSYKKDGRKSAGLIAQDVQEVLPSAVTKTEIMNIEGEHLVLEYDQVHGLLVEAIKTLTSKVEELENVINNK